MIENHGKNLETLLSGFSYVEFIMCQRQCDFINDFFAVRVKGENLDAESSWQNDET